LKIEPAWYIREAEISCMLPSDMDRTALEKAEVILETMALGLRSICDSYGDYIRMKEREV